MFVAARYNSPVQSFRPNRVPKQPRFGPQLPPVYAHQSTRTIQIPIRALPTNHRVEREINGSSPAKGQKHTDDAFVVARARRGDPMTSEINFVEISFEFREIIDSRRVAIKAKIVRNFRLNLKTNQFIMVLLEEINYTSQTRPQSVGGWCGLYCKSLGVRILLFFSFLDK